MAPTFALTVAALLLAGCSENAEPIATAGGPTPGGSPQKQVASESGTFSIRDVTTCDQVEPFVAQWLGGLVPSDISFIDESTVHCAWTSPPGEADLNEARTIEIELVASPERPDYSLLTGMKGYEGISDSWVDTRGGQAFALTIDIGLSVAIGTTVWVPGVEATVSGGKWANVPPLDAAAGLEVAKAILQQ